MPASNVRIEIPGNPGDKIALAQKIAAKHLELAEKSPLKDLKWEIITPALEAADLAHKDSKKYEAQAETATEARDKELPVVTQFLRDARDILGGVNSDQIHKLTEYGYTVTASSASSSKKVSLPTAGGK